MRILISNDDGIGAEGISALAKAMMTIGDVTVVAPDTERSATRHAITIHDYLRVKKLELPDLSCACYSVSGTPADCIKIAIDQLMPEEPDLIVSGINRGANLGTDVIYSGTVSAAIEGAILGFPAIAVSLALSDRKDYSYAAQFTTQIATHFLKCNMGSGTILNINIPDISAHEIKGVKVMPLGIRKYNDTYVRREDPSGQEYYWLTGGVAESENMENTDIAALREGYVTLTPIHIDLTKYDLIDKLKAWYLQSGK